MKRILILLIALPLAISGRAEDTIDVKSKITDVTVFLRGASITRNTEKRLSTGTTYLRLTGLTPDINRNSVQVKARGQVTILSVTPVINFLEGTTKPPRVIRLTDSLESLRTDIEINNELQRVYQEEKKMILSNKDAGWKEGSFNIEDLEDLTDFYRDRLADVMLKLLELQQKENRLEETRIRIKNQLRELEPTWRNRTSQVIVEIAANKAETVKLELNYVVNNAGWVPNYDLRANGIDKPIEVAYKAQVYQRTGIDWNQVKLTLSTGDPQLDNTKPELGKWALDFKSNRIDMYLSRALSNAAYNANSDLKTDSEGVQYDHYELAEEEPSPAGDGGGGGGGDGPNSISTAIPFMQLQVAETDLNVNFKVELPYTVPSDGDKHMVNVREFEMPADFRYYAVPKLEESAYLLARVTGWESKNIIPGTANIYFEGTYVGKSYINPKQTADTLDLSLGQDRSVVVKREQIKEFSKTQTLGSKKEHQAGYRISLRNTKQKPVEIEVLDQLPLSSQKVIEVSTIDLGGAKHNPESGKLSWKVTLSGNANQELSFRYSVKHPKSMRLANL